MRISDLSRRTGVPVATIKFYLRERLLPAGTPTGRNQAEYGEVHLRRLQLIRAFTTIGQLDLSSVRELLAAVEDDRLSLPELYQAVNGTLFQEVPTPIPRDELAEARTEVATFVDALGWRMDPGSPSATRLAQVLATLQRLGCDCGIDLLAPYAEAAERVAIAELDLLPPDGADADRAAAMARTILLAVAFVALRRIAQEHHAILRFGPAPAA